MENQKSDWQLAAEASLEAANSANKVAEEYKENLNIMTKSNVHLSDAIKDIHIALNAAEVLEDLDNLKLELGKLIISGGMIKLGVLSKALGDSNE